MPKWNHTLNLADVFHNEALSFTQRRDKIVDRIKSRNFPDDDYLLEEIIENLQDVANAKEFDEWWAAFYDYADGERIWVTTRR